MSTECYNKDLTWVQAKEDLEDAIYLADKRAQERASVDASEFMIETPLTYNTKEI